MVTVQVIPSEDTESQPVHPAKPDATPSAPLGKMAAVIVTTSPAL